MADMSKISPDAGQTIYDLKDAYARANKWGKSSQKVAGAYNLLQNTWTTAVISNVTVTKNTDRTLSTSGTSNAADDQEIGVATLPAGTYKLVGCPADGGSAAYRLKAVNKTSSNTVIGYDDGEGLIISLAADATVGVNLVFAASVPMTGLTFKPMITTDLSATYGDYVYFIKTNKIIMDELLANHYYLKDGTAPINESLPAEYEDGMTLIQTGSTNKGFPETYSFGITLRYGSNVGRTMQIWFGYSGKLYYRFGSSSSWTAWFEQQNTSSHGSASYEVTFSSTNSIAAGGTMIIPWSSFGLSGYPGGLKFTVSIVNSSSDGSKGIVSYGNGSQGILMYNALPTAKTSGKVTLCVTW